MAVDLAYVRRPAVESLDGLMPTMETLDGIAQKIAHRVESEATVEDPLPKWLIFKYAPVAQLDRASAF